MLFIEDNTLTIIAKILLILFSVSVVITVYFLKKYYSIFVKYYRFSNIGAELIFNASNAGVKHVTISNIRYQISSIRGDAKLDKKKIFNIVGRGNCIKIGKYFVRKALEALHDSLIAKPFNIFYVEVNNRSSLSNKDSLFVNVFECLIMHKTLDVDYKEKMLSLLYKLKDDQVFAYHKKLIIRIINYTRIFDGVGFSFFSHMPSEDLFICDDGSKRNYLKARLMLLIKCINTFNYDVFSESSLKVPKLIADILMKKDFIFEDELNDYLSLIRLYDELNEIIHDNEFEFYCGRLCGQYNSLDLSIFMDVISFIENNSLCNYRYNQFFDTSSNIAEKIKKTIYTLKSIIDGYKNFKDQQSSENTITELSGSRCLDFLHIQKEISKYLEHKNQLVIFCDKKYSNAVCLHDTIDDVNNIINLFFDSWASEIKQELIKLTIDIMQFFTPLKNDLFEFLLSINFCHSNDVDDFDICDSYAEQISECSFEKNPLLHNKIQELMISTKNAIDDLYENAWQVKNCCLFNNFFFSSLSDGLKDQGLLPLR